jgi:type IV secretory pathway component VirB8
VAFEGQQDRFAVDVATIHQALELAFLLPFPRQVPFVVASPNQTASPASAGSSAHAHLVLVSFELGWVVDLARSQV